MKKILDKILIAGLVFCLIGPGAAIDKSKKDQKPEAPKQTETKNPDKKPAKKTESGKNYNDFIDANNNGIDDRAEKKALKKKPQKDTTSQQKDKPPQP